MPTTDAIINDKIGCSFGTDIRAEALDDGACHSYGIAMERISAIVYVLGRKSNVPRSGCASPESRFVQLGIPLRGTLLRVNDSAAGEISIR